MYTVGQAGNALSAAANEAIFSSLENKVDSSHLESSEKAAFNAEIDRLREHAKENDLGMFATTSLVDVIDDSPLFTAAHVRWAKKQIPGSGLSEEEKAAGSTLCDRIVCGIANGDVSPMELNAPIQQHLMKFISSRGSDADDEASDGEASDDEATDEEATDGEVTDDEASDDEASDDEASADEAPGGGTADDEAPAEEEAGDDEDEGGVSLRVWKTKLSDEDIRGFLEDLQPVADSNGLDEVPCKPDFAEIIKADVDSEIGSE